MAVIKYWRQGALHGQPPGIGIVAEQQEFADYLEAGGKLSDMYNFAWYTSRCLDYINATVAGRRLITSLSRSRVMINYHPTHNMVTTSNDVASLSQVASEILQHGVPGPASRQAARAMNLFKFLGEFRRQPLLDVAANPSAILTANLPVNDDALGQWIEKGRTPDGLSPAQLLQLKHATISALDRFSPRGPGCPSGVGFCIDQAGEYNLNRPPAVGLAHELVHAYLSFEGRQCGRYQDYALFEFKCVGLGRPWLDSEVSENAIRAQWAAALPLVPAADVANRRPAPPRSSYD